jgi:hypothetical protein
MELKTKINKLETKKEKLALTIPINTNKHKFLRKEIDDTENKLENLQYDYDELDEEIDCAKDEIDTYDEEIKNLTRVDSFMFKIIQYRNDDDHYKYPIEYISQDEIGCICFNTDDYNGEYMDINFEYFEVWDFEDYKICNMKEFSKKYQKTFNLLSKLSIVEQRKKKLKKIEDEK